MKNDDPGQQQPAIPSETVSACGVHAEGPRSVAVGGDARLIQTGDNASVQVVELSVGAFPPIAEVDAPPGIDKPPAWPGPFVGREVELGQLDTVLGEPGPVVVAVHGLGGIGKSTLIARWAYDRPHGYSPILWIGADTAAEITQGLADFATALQPVLAKVLDIEQLAERGSQWLATHTGWLLILDNVHSLTDIEPLLARAKAGGRIIITSRRATGWPSGIAVVRLDVLAPEKSRQLLISLLTMAGPRDESGAAELCSALGHLPLAIEQAGAYLAQNPFITPRTYLTMLTDYPADMFGRAAVDSDPDRAIARIWRVTLDRITAIQPAAGDLLRTLAWYGPDAIPLTLCQALADPPTLNTAIGILTAYSMITPDPERARLSIHRLVQAVARTPDLNDPHRNPAVIELARDRAARNLSAELPDHLDPATWPSWRALLPHIDALSSHVRSLPPTITVAAVLSATGHFLLGQGLHTSALVYLHQALTDQEQMLGIDYPDTLTTRNNLAYTYRGVGRVLEAIELFEQTLTDRERILGDQHPDTLTTRHYLAHTYSSIGRLDDAIELYEQTLTDRERTLGDQHPDTLHSRHSLAYSYRAVGRLAETIELFERNLTDREQTLGSLHPDTLHSRHSLSGAYRAVGRLDEAIDLFQRTLTDREGILGDEHPDTLNSRNNLGSAYTSMGRATDAIELLKQTLTDRERILGDQHPDTLTTRNNLGIAYRSAGQVTAAIELLEQILTDRERVLLTNHPDVLTSRNHLAYTYLLAGRLDEAIELFARTLSDRERLLGHEHPHTLTTRHNLADAYVAAGRSNDAINLYEQTLADSERILGPEHPSIRMIRDHLAVARKQQPSD
ncbi:tetratricopeptide repeat protein [Nocardia sp.]|uniref:tetratricopeptide repeat protein n=1 Tax=Nocardia sp. TaxID=1821 RepID=UPI0025908FA2|nr:tetratricopeptide repeat protein [Nocardia sp.]